MLLGRVDEAGTLVRPVALAALCGLREVMVRVVAALLVGWSSANPDAA